MKALVIARLTFREGLRKKLVLGVVLLSLVFIVLYVWGFSLFVQDWRAMEARRAAAGAGMTLPYEVFASAMVLLGLWTVNFLAGVMTIFASVGTIASEIEQGTLHAIVSEADPSVGDRARQMARLRTDARRVHRCDGCDRGAHSPLRR